MNENDHNYHSNRVYAGIDTGVVPTDYIWVWFGSRQESPLVVDGGEELQTCDGLSFK